MPKLPMEDAVAVASVSCVSNRKPGLVMALLALSVLPSQLWAAGFIDDSHGTLTLRNYYLDRDYKDDGAKTAAREWAQAFILNLESGYTPGPLGFGLDVRGLSGGQARFFAGPQRHRVVAGVGQRQACRR